MTLEQPKGWLGLHACNRIGFILCESRRGEKACSMKLNVVIPIYNEQENLPELAERLKTVCQSLEGVQWQVIYVDDGSTDRSEAIMKEQYRLDPRFTVVSLSRNFGHQAALAAGLAHGSDADAVVLMDGDLQDPPEVIPELVAAWRAGAAVRNAACVGSDSRRFIVCFSGSAIIRSRRIPVYSDY